MCKITDLFRIRIYINEFFESYYHHNTKPSNYE